MDINFGQDVWLAESLKQQCILTQNKRRSRSGLIDQEAAYAQHLNGSMSETGNKEDRRLKRRSDHHQQVLMPPERANTAEDDMIPSNEDFLAAWCIQHSLAAPRFTCEVIKPHDYTRCVCDIAGLRSRGQVAETAEKAIETAAKSMWEMIREAGLA